MPTFNENRRRCSRLSGFLDQVPSDHPGYHALPVNSFCEAKSRFLTVWLVPGMHGANRAGRPFTGGFTGICLYNALYKYGFVSSTMPLGAAGGANLSMHLTGCRITNAVRCLPPQNKPEPSETRTCNSYVAEELAMLPQGSAVMVLGRIAHQAVVTALGLRKSSYVFGHGERHELPGGLTLFDSYHYSRYNTQTKRLTTERFEAAIRDVAAHLVGAGHARE